MDPAPHRVSRIRWIRVEGNLRLGSQGVKEIDDLFEERPHRRRLPEAISHLTKDREMPNVPPRDE
jgi:hypothetical protein